MVLNTSAAVTSLVLVSLLAACASHSGGTQSGTRLSQTSVAAVSRTTNESAAPMLIEELKMGADCGSGATTDAPLEDVACSGHLPEHFASFLRRIPHQHPFLSGYEREQLSRSKHSFKAVVGLGERHDILAVIHHYSPFWIRSFEGPDPDVTLYLVYGPECGSPRSGDSGSSENRCRPDSAYLRDYTLYRVQKDGIPRDVTSEMAPPAPHLDKEERRRYGPYLRGAGGAVDSDIQMDVSRLAYVPVLRWVLRPAQEGEYMPPSMPSSDPRAFKDYYRGTGSVAHFGFLIWNGRRMELRETVPSTLWPCRSSNPPVCDQGYDSSADRYLD